MRRISNLQRTVMIASFMTLTYVFPQIYFMDKQQRKTPNYGRKQTNKYKTTSSHPAVIQPLLLPNTYQIVDIFILFSLEKSYKKPCFT